LRSIGINDYINSVTVYTPNKMKKTNASVVVQKAPGSKGVTPGMNPKATVVPGGQPSKLYGGKMKKGGAMMKKMGKKK
jgi:hypothetical protein